MGSALAVGRSISRSQSPGWSLDPHATYFGHPILDRARDVLVAP